MSMNPAPRVIVKEGFSLDDRLGENTPVPEIKIFANESGLRWLSEFFRLQAENAAKLGRNPAIDMDEHAHLDVTWEPFDYVNSDHVSIIVVPLATATQSHVFDKFGISPQTAQHRSIIDRSADINREIESCLQRRE